jgi:hypothetical protein
VLLLCVRHQLASIWCKQERRGASQPKGKACAGSFDSAFTWIDGAIDSAQRHACAALGKAMLAYFR